MTHQHRQLTEIVRYQLFGGEKPPVSGGDCAALLQEATAQTVFSLVFPFVRGLLQATAPEQFSTYNELFLGNVMTNTNNFMEHSELHRLMTDCGVAYCAVKGLASAYYYPEAALRDMGDVDYLVAESDFSRARAAVLSAGFSVDHGDSADSIHIAFKRAPLSIWEQHRSVNGVPGGAVGERLQAELDKTIATSRLVTLDGATCQIPDDFHHGLIMLLHMISHLTSEGIGLRHLCDWAVFVNRIGSEDFAALFESRLKSYGIWKFAQLMTLVSERYLGISRQAWAHTVPADSEQLEEILDDILRGGNFGKKDGNRYREIKYISNRGDRTVDGKNVAAQAFGTLNHKVYTDFPLIKKNKLLLPCGWVAEGGRYIGLLLRGERKNSGTSAMLREAAKRKSIYSKMDLFIEK